MFRKLIRKKNGFIIRNKLYLQINKKNKITIENINFNKLFNLILEVSNSNSIEFNIYSSNHKSNINSTYSFFHNNEVLITDNTNNDYKKKKFLEGNEINTDNFKNEDYDRTVSDLTHDDFFTSKKSTSFDYEIDFYL